MEDKITLGKFIQSKRKELGMSQKELAKALYVTESAVSKWERGISYPDITMISGICRTLGISEHELCTASEDYQQRETELMARSYKRFKCGYTVISVACYLAAIIPCFIVNLVNEGRLSWFFILLTSLMLTFSLINVPVLVKHNKGLATLGSSLLSIILMYAAGCIYSGGDWFLMAAVATLLGAAVIFLPFVLRCEPLEKIAGNNKALICMAADTILTFLCVLYGTFKYGNAEDVKGGLITFAVCASIVWMIFLVIRYARVNVFFKASICSAVCSVFIVAANVFVNVVMNGIELTSKVFSLSVDNEFRINNIVALVFLGCAVVLSVVGVVRNIKRKKTGQD